MRKLSASFGMVGVIAAACLSLASIPASAQIQPRPAQVQQSAPQRLAQSAPRAPSVARQPAKPGTATSTRKYDRNYKTCKGRALRRGLKGAERRAFIRRCELGFAPPRSQTANPAPAVPVPAPKP